MAKSSEEIVDEVEALLKDSQPCPYCGLFDGTHQATCEYLKHKGNVDAKRAKKVSTKTEEKEVSKETSEEASNQKETKKLLDQMKPKSEK